MSKNKLPDNPDTIKKKSIMLEALEQSLGIVTTACRAAGVGRATYYEWMHKDDTFKEAVTEITEIALDFAESRLLNLIREGDTSSTIFYLKTKGKHRGYVEKQIHDHNVMTVSERTQFSLKARGNDTEQD